MWDVTKAEGYCMDYWPDSLDVQVSLARPVAIQKSSDIQQISSEVVLTTSGAKITLKELAARHLHEHSATTLKSLAKAMGLAPGKTLQQSATVILSALADIINEDDAKAILDGFKQREQKRKVSREGEHVDAEGMDEGGQDYVAEMAKWDDEEEEVEVQEKAEEKVVVLGAASSDGASVDGAELASSSSSSASASKPSLSTVSTPSNFQPQPLPKAPEQVRTVPPGCKMKLVLTPHNSPAWSVTLPPGETWLGTHTKRMAFRPSTVGCELAKQTTPHPGNKRGEAAIASELEAQAAVTDWAWDWWRYEHHGAAAAALGSLSGAGVAHEESPLPPTGETLTTEPSKTAALASASSSETSCMQAKRKAETSQPPDGSSKRPKP
jgi:hypothetical protein